MVAPMRCLDCDAGWDVVGGGSGACADCGSDNIEIDHRVWVRDACPTCGARTSDEADKICKPVVHCPACEVDNDGFLIWLRERSDLQNSTVK